MSVRGVCIVLVLALGVGAAACRGTVGAGGDPCVGDPDVAVMELRNQWENAPCQGLHNDGRDACGDCGGRSKELIRRQAENLLFRYPRHVPTRMFAALLAYEAGDSMRATNHLDDVLALQPVHPEAVVLRARIALEQGNTLHARTLLEDQANLKPDHAGLQEALASAHHMEGHDEEALAALDRAEMLGAPEHRTLYNRGLIEEKRGNPDLAISLYRRSVRRMPDWPPASARLRGLGASAYGPTDASPETSAAPAAQPAMPLPPSPPASALLPPAGDAANDLPGVGSR